MTTTPTYTNFDSADERRRPEVDVHLNVSTRTVLRLLLVVAIFLALTDAVRQIGGVLIQIVVAAFLAVAADTVVRALQRRGLSRGRAVATFMAGLVAALTLMLLVLVPPVVEQGARLVDDAPQYVDDVRRAEWFQRLDARFDVTDKGLDQLEQLATSVPSQLGTALGAVIGGVFSTITLLFLIVFMLLGGGDLLRGVLRAVPQLTERRAWIVVQGAYRNIGQYFVGALLQGTIAGLSLAIALFLAGVPFALPLGLFMLLLDLIPLVGATIGAIPAVLVAFIAGDHGIWSGFAVLAFIVVYQQIENVVIQPRIQGKVAALPGIMIFVSVLIGAELMGIVGALFAVPVAGVIAIVYRQYLEVTGATDIDLPSVHDQPA